MVRLTCSAATVTNVVAAGSSGGGGRCGFELVQIALDSLEGTNNEL